MVWEKSGQSFLNIYIIIRTSRHQFWPRNLWFLSKMATRGPETAIKFIVIGAYCSNIVLIDILKHICFSGPEGLIYGPKITESNEFYRNWPSKTLKIFGISHKHFRHVNKCAIQGVTGIICQASKSMRVYALHLVKTISHNFRCYIW